MLKNIITFSVRQKYVALSLVVLMAVAGYFSLIQLPINSLPDVTPVQVLVITKAGRYSPFDVEKLVSYPIETAMNGLPDVAEVRSISQFGLSAVTVEFQEKTDLRCQVCAPWVCCRLKRGWFPLHHNLQKFSHQTFLPTIA